MKRTFLPIMALCLTAAPVLYGCDGHKSKTNNDSNSSATAENQNDEKRYYSPEAIEKMDVAGFRLGMSQEQAEARLQQDQWQGRFPAMPQDQDSETYAKAFEQPGKMLVLFRHRAPDGTLRIADIKLVQKFELPHDKAELLGALEKKYGPATESGGNETYTIPEWYSRPIGNKTDCGWHVNTCNEKQLADNAAIDNMPKLKAEITANSVTIELISGRMIAADAAAIKAVADKAAAEQLKRNSESEKVKF